MSYNPHKQLVDTRKLSLFIYGLFMAGLSPKDVEEVLLHLDNNSEQQLNEVENNMTRLNLLPLYQYACECVKRLL